MKLSVSTSFDSNLLYGLQGLSVTTVYGKVSQDIFGGGRPAIMLSEVNRNRVEEHVKIAHSLGIKFDYLLNTTCMDNLEFTKEINEKIFTEVEWLKSIKVDRITVALPFLIDIIKKRAPEISIGLSTYACVDTLEKAKRFEQMGVDEITLPEGLNRNFEIQRLLRKNLKCNLRLIATNTCSGSCPYRIYHMNAGSHASQANHISKGFYMSYPMLRCTEFMVKNPVEIIKSPWIRPEDLHYYEDIGIDNFKITERSKKTEILVNIAKSYSNRKHDGDLARLLNFRVKSDYIRPNFKLMKASGIEDNEDWEDYFNLLFAQKVKINNQALEGFLEFFIRGKQDCRNMLCGKDCLHCHKYAEKALVIDREYNQSILEEFEKFFSKLSDKNLTGCPL